MFRNTNNMLKPKALWQRLNIVAKALRAKFYCNGKVLPGWKQKFSNMSHLGSSTVTCPFGWISTLFPQNLSLGWIEPWNIKSWQSAWNADIGGWWLTCSHTTLKTSNTHLHYGIIITDWHVIFNNAVTTSKSSETSRNNADVIKYPITQWS